MIGTIGALWGVIGVSLLLLSAVYRLASYAIDASSYELSWLHWTALILLCVFMAYSEGFRAFQKGFSPRVAARARHLRQNPRFFHVLLAPLFCMAFFHAPRRRRITSLSVTAGIVVLVILVRLLPQPWRGIIDASVVIGLAWGFISLLVFSIQAFTAAEFRYSPEVPGEDKDSTIG